MLSLLDDTQRRPDGELSMKVGGLAEDVSPGEKGQPYVSHLARARARAMEKATERAMAMEKG